MTMKDIKSAFTIDKNPEKNQKINLYTFKTKVPTSLGNPDCVELLKAYSEASDEHLQLQQPAMYIEALWNFNWNLILIYGLLTVWQFLILALTVIFEPTN